MQLCFKKKTHTHTHHNITATLSKDSCRSIPFFIDVSVQIPFDDDNSSSECNIYR